MNVYKTVYRPSNYNTRYAHKICPYSIYKVQFELNFYQKDGTTPKPTFYYDSFFKEYKQQLVLK